MAVLSGSTPKYLLRLYNDAGVQLDPSNLSQVLEVKVQVAAAHRTPLVLMGELVEILTLQVAVMAAVQVAAGGMEGELTEIMAMVTVDQVG